MPDLLPGADRRYTFVDGAGRVSMLPRLACEAAGLAARSMESCRSSIAAAAGAAPTEVRDKKTDRRRNKMSEKLGSLNQTRRALLAGGVGAAAAVIGQSVLPARSFAQDRVDPRVTRILADTITVDMHNHDGQPAFAKTPADASPDIVATDWAAQMKRAGLTAVCLTYAVDSFRTPEKGDWYQFHLQCLAHDDRLLAANGVRRALTVADLKAAHASKTPTAIQASEGAHWIEGRLERVEEAYKRGLRHLQLLHQLNDLVAPLGGVQQQLAAVGGAGAPGGPALADVRTTVSGLTAFGADVIRECNRLGIVVDMAHAHRETLMAALKVSQQPLTVTHTAFDSDISRSSRMYLTNPGLTARLVNRDYAKAVADAGGIMGVWNIFPTMKDYVTGLKQMVDAAGVDHVGIGTDTSVAPRARAPAPRPANAPAPNAAGAAPPRAAPAAPTGTNNVWPDEKNGFLNSVATEMLNQGFTPAEVSKIAGGNYVRLFGTVTRS